MSNSKGLQEIRKLLILQLLYQGVPAEFMGEVLGMNPNSIRNMFPLRKLKKGEDSGKKAKK